MAAIQNAKVIRREIELRPGDVYQQDLVQESRGVFILNYFKDVQIRRILPR